MPTQSFFGIASYGSAAAASASSDQLERVCVDLDRGTVAAVVPIVLVPDADAIVAQLAHAQRAWSIAMAYTSGANASEPDCLRTAFDRTNAPATRAFNVAVREIWLSAGIGGLLGPSRRRFLAADAEFNAAAYAASFPPPSRDFAKVWARAVPVGSRHHVRLIPSGP